MNRFMPALWSLVCTVLFAPQGLVAQNVERPQGSTLTLEQLNASRSSSPTAGPKEVEATPLVCSMAAEANPTFRYRLWPRIVDLKPRSAFMHFSRAIILYQQTSEKARKEWNAFQVANDESMMQAESIDAQLATFGSVFLELNRMSECEDLSWDQRIRDEKGSKIYEYLLPEAQVARDLARLLKYRAIECLQQRDFEGAIQNIRTGYQLSTLLRKGETLVQQLVGIAIERLMQECVVETIKTPGSPNLYWALASIPHSESMRRSIEIETEIFGRLFSIFDQPEDQHWDRETWQSKWRESIRELEVLQEMNLPAQRLALASLIASESTSGLNDVKNRLQASGINSKVLETMFPEQILAIDTQQELRRQAERISRTFYLPYAESRALGIADEANFTAWAQDKNRSVAKTVASLLFPAVLSARRAEVRHLAIHNRLMAVEAIRAYAASNGGQLPPDLSALVASPVADDPISNKPIVYSVANEGGVPTATLEIEDPMPNVHKLKIQIRK